MAETANQVASRVACGCPCQKYVVQRIACETVSYPPCSIQTITYYSTTRTLQHITGTYLYLLSLLLLPSLPTNTWYKVSSTTIYQEVSSVLPSSNFLPSPWWRQTWTPVWKHHLEPINLINSSYRHVRKREEEASAVHVAMVNRPRNERGAMLGSCRRSRSSSSSSCPPTKSWVSNDLEGNSRTRPAVSVSGQQQRKVYPLRYPTTMLISSTRRHRYRPRPVGFPAQWRVTNKICWTHLPAVPGHHRQHLYRND